MQSLVFKIFFTCLLFPFASNSLAASFSSKKLQNLSSTTSKYKAVNYPNVEFCKVVHSKLSFESKKVPNGEALRNKIFEIEKKKEPWAKAITWDNNKLQSFDDFTRSTNFADLFIILDGVYCFHNLDRDQLPSSQARNNIQASFNNYNKDLKIYIYYEDGLRNENPETGISTRLLVIYLTDLETKEVYALRGLETY